jgi:hypothetical protein
MNKKEQFLALITDLITNNDSDKKILAERLYNHLKQYTINMDAESRNKIVINLVNSIENFVEYPENLTYKDELKTHLVFFSNLIEN